MVFFTGKHTGLGYGRPVLMPASFLIVILDNLVFCIGITNAKSDLYYSLLLLESEYKQIVGRFKLLFLEES